MLYKAIEKVKMIGEGNRTESDHMLETELTGKEKKRKEGKKNDIRIKEKSVEEGVMQYHEKCEGWQCSQEENGWIWNELKGNK